MKEKVLVVSKTHMNNGHCCVGAVTLNGEFIRLKDANGHNQPDDVDFTLGKVYWVEYEKNVNTIPPHVEDVFVSSHKFYGKLKDDITFVDFLTKRNVFIHSGSVDDLFQGFLKWTHTGSGYVTQEAIPDNSVGFWISDRDLEICEFYGTRYSYPSTHGSRRLKFVGYQDTVDVIPAGTLMRVSLARWWQKDEYSEDSCYLQLSGWYN